MRELSRSTVITYQIENMSKIAPEYTTVPLPARVEGLLADLLENRDLLFRAKALSQGAVCILLPQAMDQNIDRFQSVFEELGLEYRICFAHKANKSPAFVAQAEVHGIDVDVASKYELVSALSAGFTGKRIVCTGPKNREFIRLAIKHSCLLCADSLMEMNIISEEALTITDPESVKVLVRVSDVCARDRVSIVNTSRFGLPKHHLGAVFDLIRANTKIEFTGFHIHNDVRDKDAKAGFIDDLLILFEQAYAQGFTPTILDLGGGFRSRRVHSLADWSRFLDTVSLGLLQKSDTGTWRKFGLGMSIGDKGAVVGRDRIQGKYSSDEEFDDVLQYILLDESFRGRALAKIIAENGITVLVEPGMALLQQCALTVFTVIGCKEAADGSNLVLVDGNSYNLSLGVTEPLTDPVLIPRTLIPCTGLFKAALDAPYSAYVIGNMCREEDVITKRRIPFSRPPKEGDLLCFLNTAPYNCDFEDASPHLHPRTERVVALRSGTTWSLTAENSYDPYNLIKIDSEPKNDH